ncbi:hypothetical protein V8C86DRAFT_2535019 [Haematococcus lacustris]
MERIRVALRVRPLLKKEAGLPVAFSTSGEAVAQRVASKGRRPTCSIADADVRLHYADAVLGADASNAEVFSKVVPAGLLERSLEVHTTVLAYGQTGSGKTHSMTGHDGDPGLVPLILLALFNKAAAQTHRDFTFSLSAMEVYNEQINDLLNIEASNLVLKADVSHGGGRESACMMKVEGLTEKVVTNTDDTLALIQSIQKNRTVRATLQNDRSSRSHTIIKLDIQSRAKAEPADSAQLTVKDLSVTCVTVTLVDLAGSEGLGRAGSNGVQLAEGKAINQSLLTLGKVMRLLAGTKGSHIPYRESKLTRLLQPSLEGNAQVVLLATISPLAMAVAESESTLDFMAQAKRVTTHATAVRLEPESVQIKRLVDERRHLLTQVSQLQEALSCQSTISQYISMPAKPPPVMSGSFKGRSTGSALQLSGASMALSLYGGQSLSPTHLFTKEPSLREGLDASGALPAAKWRPHSFRHSQATQRAHASLMSPDAPAQPRGSVPGACTAPPTKAEHAQTMEGHDIGSGAIASHPVCLTPDPSPYGTPVLIKSERQSDLNLRTFLPELGIPPSAYSENCATPRPAQIQAVLDSNPAPSQAFGSPMLAAREQAPQEAAEVEMEAAQGDPADLPTATAMHLHPPTDPLCLAINTEDCTELQVEEQGEVQLRSLPPAGSDKQPTLPSKGQPGSQPGAIAPPRPPPQAASCVRGSARVGLAQLQARCCHHSAPLLLHPPATSLQQATLLHRRTTDDDSSSLASVSTRQASSGSIQAAAAKGEPEGRTQIGPGLGAGLRLSSKLQQQLKDSEMRCKRLEAEAKEARATSAKLMKQLQEAAAQQAVVKLDLARSNKQLEQANKRISTLEADLDRFAKQSQWPSMPSSAAKGRLRPAMAGSGIPGPAPVPRPSGNAERPVVKLAGAQAWCAASIATQTQDDAKEEEGIKLTAMKEELKVVAAAKEALEAKLAMSDAALDAANLKATEMQGLLQASEQEREVLMQQAVQQELNGKAKEPLACARCSVLQAALQRSTEQLVASRVLNRQLQSSSAPAPAPALPGSPTLDLSFSLSAGEACSPELFHFDKQAAELHPAATSSLETSNSTQQELQQQQQEQLQRQLASLWQDCPEASNSQLLVTLPPTPAAAPGPTLKRESSQAHPDSPCSSTAHHVSDLAAVAGHMLASQGLVTAASVLKVAAPQVDMASNKERWLPFDPPVATCLGSQPDDREQSGPTGLLSPPDSYSTTDELWEWAPTTSSTALPQPGGEQGTGAPQPGHKLGALTGTMAGHAKPSQGLPPTHWASASHGSLALELVDLHAAEGDLMPYGLCIAHVCGHNSSSTTCAASASQTIE